MQTYKNISRIAVINDNHKDERSWHWRQPTFLQSQDSYYAPSFYKHIQPCYMTAARKEYWFLSMTSTKHNESTVRTEKTWHRKRAELTKFLP